MATSYFRRFRMELDFVEVRLPRPVVPADYQCLPWHSGLLDRHAIVKYESFRSEIDSRVFRCLGEIAGCYRLMEEIADQETFLPQATWLMTYRPANHDDWVDCGTIQGLGQTKSFGSVQNIGVVPDHRGLGLGKALMLYSLHGFRSAGVRRVFLEVTVENRSAVNLYRSLGFRLMRTTYRAAEVPEAFVS